jgi:hypothetical protein
VSEKPSHKIAGIGLNTLGAIWIGQHNAMAIAGNPLQHITEMERVRFVMKGGVVMRDELTTAASPVTR